MHATYVKYNVILWYMLHGTILLLHKQSRPPGPGAWEHDCMPSGYLMQCSTTYESVTRASGPHPDLHDEHENSASDCLSELSHQHSVFTDNRYVCSRTANCSDLAKLQKKVVGATFVVVGQITTSHF